MSQLIYDVRLEEEFETAESYQRFCENLPHFKEISEWLPKVWKKCCVEKSFTDCLKDKIEITTLRCFTMSDGTAIARITVSFIPNFRLTKERRDSCFRQLNGQMTDGFGEMVDGHQIPGAESGYKLFL